MRYYHVIAQSYYGREILPEEDDCLEYLMIARRAFQKYDIHWMGYAVMPTHVHLLVGVNAAENGTVNGTAEANDGDDKSALLTLQKARRKITFAYTTYMRKKRPELLGKENRIFHPKVTVKSLSTLHDVKRVICYIHLNPLRKGLETTVGESIRSSYNAILATWEPQDMENLFNRFWELNEIRDALAIGEIGRAFGKNRNEQKRNFLSSHSQPVSESTWQDVMESAQMVASKKDMLEKAERIVKTYFMKNYSFGKREFTEENRELFLRWLNRRGNPHKEELVLFLRKNTRLTAHEIAVLLHIGDSTVRRIVGK